MLTFVFLPIFRSSFLPLKLTTSLPSTPSGLPQFWNRASSLLLDSTSPPPPHLVSTRPTRPHLLPSTPTPLTTSPTTTARVLRPQLSPIYPLDPLLRRAQRVCPPSRPTSPSISPTSTIPPLTFTSNPALSPPPPPSSSSHRLNLEFQHPRRRRRIRNQGRRDMFLVLATLSSCSGWTSSRRS